MVYKFILNIVEEEIYCLWKKHENIYYLKLRTFINVAGNILIFSRRKILIFSSRLTRKR
jgi:hypothetical protein